MMRFIYIFIAWVSLSLGMGQAQTYHFASIKGLIEQEVGRKVLPEIYRKLGLEITITPEPAPRAQRDVVSGVKDGEILRIWTYGIQNPTTIRVPVPYYYLETMAFVRKDSGIVIRRPEDLRKYRIVKVRGVKHTDVITAGLPQVFEIGSTEQMMRFLQAGRADVALTNTIDGVFELKRLGLTEIVSAGERLAVWDLFHYVHEDHRDLVPRVAAAIEAMRASGELDSLVRRAEREVIGE